MYRCGIETTYDRLCVLLLYGINCTVVELKQGACLLPPKGPPSINCTVVELKLKNQDWNLVATLVLIVPLWNWNYKWKFHDIVKTIVLIVPLWNWNNCTPIPAPSIICINCTVVELKQHPYQTGLQTMCRINCTVVELKQIRLHTRKPMGRVLIVPLWNWNYHFRYEVLVSGLY